MNMFIDSEIFSAHDIERIEEHYKAQYVCETCVRGHGGWMNRPVDVFYQEDESLVPEGGSQYLGLYWQHYADNEGEKVAEPQLMITNAESATEPFDAIVADDGEIVFSRYRHDYRKSKDGSVFVDGGRDYLRCSLGAEVVKLGIVDGKLQVIEE